MAQPTLDQTNPQVIEDAVKLLKSDFTALYEKQGYNKVLVGIAWHNIRVTPKAQALAKQLHPPGHSHDQALSFISDVDEEVQARKEEKPKKKKVKTQEVVKTESVSVVTVDVIEKPKKEKKEPIVTGEKSEKGARGKIAKELLARPGGATVEELMEKAGVAKLYAQMLIRQSKKK